MPRPFSFNRNIVECKVRQGTRYASATLVLIETLWNVKEYQVVYHENRILVLIETLWNVKEKRSKSVLPGAIVLIETLWNVKKRWVMR